MAGDHKCPVCNSTFTRPQHVARHMRSHTGDRPYKCQHCGDQFARSDLLSRHINKCHASEKPPTTTAPNNRRKGTAAASRATTSKQACDQCVTSSLPCDGCNPCSKCISRKVRCTYVKFHRQTAPAGPGHPPPNAMPNAVHRGPVALGRLPDDFLLPPGTAGAGLAPMYLPPDYSLPVSSLYAAHPYDARPNTAPSLAMPPSGRDSIDTSPDVMARYRAQAELLSRAAMLPNAAIGNMSTSSAMMGGMYSADHSSLGRYGLPSSQADAWPQAGGQAFTGKGLSEYASSTDERPFPGGGGSAALSSHPPAHGAPYPDLSGPAGHAPGADSHASGGPNPYGGGIPFPQHNPRQGNPYSHHRRSEELSDDFGSESGASVPSSANSSNIHLPMVDQHEQRRPYTAESASPTLPYQHSGRKDDGTGEGGFSSAFGLMSLDDPNVLAGLANDSAPFFSALPASSFPHAGGDSSTNSASASSASLHSESSTDASSHTSHTSQSSADSSSGLGMNLPTPTPELLASWGKSGLLSAGGKDGLDSKELRDFWKQYMRTPLTGPGGNTPLFPLQTPTGPGQQLGHAASGSRPSPTRRHSRVASLPSMKTPPIFGTSDVPEFNHFAPSGNFSLSLGPKARERQSQSHRDGESQHPQTQISFSSVRTTLHGDAEDLKSYEQAVLARKAPTTLNLVPRRRGTMPPGSSAPTMKNMSPPQFAFSASAASSGVGSLSQATNAGQMSGSKIGELLNRDRPGSSSSSLADAFTSSSHSPPQHHDQHSYQYLQEHQYQSHPHSQSSESPRESSVGAESDSATSASYRPSFKRLASQTLGPENTKRALLGPAGWEDTEDAVDDDDDGESERRNRRYAGRGYGQSQGVRRFSMPTSADGAVTLPPLRSTQSQEGQGSNA